VVSGVGINHLADVIGLDLEKPSEYIRGHGTLPVIHAKEIDPEIDFLPGVWRISAGVGVRVRVKIFRVKGGFEVGAPWLGRNRHISLPFHYRP